MLRAVIVTQDGRIYKSVEEIEDDYIERMGNLIKDVQWEKIHQVILVLCIRKQLV